MTLRTRILLLIIILLMVIIFHLLGNTADTHIFGRSTINWMATRWHDYKGHFSHGYFIPLISIFLVVSERKRIAEADKCSDNKALIIISSALILQLISARTHLPRLSIISMILLIWSIPWYLFGRQVAKLIMFPCAYLFFCIPWTFLDSLTFPLRLLSSKIATGLLNGFGIDSVRKGTAILSRPPGQFSLDVADPCSGLNYILVLLALGALYAHLSRKTIFQKWMIFLSAGPIAIIANVVRIVAIAGAAIVVSADFADGLYHDYSGYIVFVSAVLMLITFSALLNINIKEKLKKWKSQAQNHTL